MKKVDHNLYNLYSDTDDAAFVWLIKTNSIFIIIYYDDASKKPGMSIFDHK